jgi:hypothetical protein
VQLARSVAAGVESWWKDPGPALVPIHALKGSGKAWASGSALWFPDEELGDGETDSTYSIDEQNPGRPVLDHGIDTGIFDVLKIPVSALGFAGVFDVNGDGISLVARTLDKSGAIIESSDTARIFIRVNSEHAAALPFSFQLNPSGAQKCDLMSIVARVQRVWITVETISQDPNQDFLIVAFTKSVAVAGLFGSSGFASASAPSGAPPTTVAAAASGGSAPGSGGGTGGSGGTGGTGGTGGSGGDGGGRGGRVGL